MPIDQIDLLKHSANVHSQWGEDGILEKIASLLKIDRGYFIEFGAWDGMHFSNTYNLVSKGWSGLYVEADPEKFEVLKKNITSPAIALVNCFVRVDGADKLDNILARVSAPAVPDVLSIDIDSVDLAVWESLKNYRPRCVVIEYNPTIPFDTEFVCPSDKAWGNSALSINLFAQRADYALVAITGTNLVFLERQVAVSLNVLQYPLDVKHCSNFYRYFWGYDGTLLCRIPQSDIPNPEVIPIPWHSYVVPQPMLKVQRFWTGSTKHRRLEQITSGLILLISRPITFFGFIRDKMRAS